MVFWASVAALSGLGTVVVGQDAPRLHTLLPSGAVIFAENQPNAAFGSLVLTYGIRGVGPETPERHGWRHLLEHLKMRPGGVSRDREFETLGLATSAITTRDALQIEVRFPPERFSAAVDALAEFTQTVSPSVEVLQNELRILREEQALEPVSARLSKAVWADLYGRNGLDPFGNLEAMAAATPAELIALQRALQRAENVVLAASGPIDVDEATRLLRRLAARFPGSGTVRHPQRPAGSRTVATVALREGRALGLAVDGFSEPETAAVLAAGLLIASEVENAFVLYTPSLGPGTVVIGQSPSGTLQERVGALEPDSAAGSLGTARRLGRAWLRSRLANPSGSALFRSLLLVQSSGLRPNTLEENLDALTEAQLRAAMARWKGASR